MPSSRKQLKMLVSLKVLQEIKILIEKEKKRKVVRKCWMKPLLVTRMEHDLEAHLLKDLAWGDDDSDFRNFTRIHVNKFEDLLQMVHSRLKKADTVMRAAITPRVKLCVTLRYIATGDSYKSLEFLSRLSRNTIGVFVPEVLDAIYESLQPKYLKVRYIQTKAIS